MSKQHHYRIRLNWQGNLGDGTRDYRSYSREHELSAAKAPPIPGSADPAFRGDALRWNPEQLLLASLSACHQLWYLHLCSTNGVVVMAYQDEAEAEMRENPDGSGEFIRATLRPAVTLAKGSDAALANALHAQAHKLCFIARSMNFEVGHQPQSVQWAAENGP